MRVELANLLGNMTLLTYDQNASADSTAIIQAVDDLATLFERGLARATRGLTPAECQQYLRGRPCLGTVSEE